MEAVIEKVWYQSFDWSMIWVCLIAVAVHLLYLDMNKKAVKYTWKNYAFYLLSSILVLAFISEVAMPIVSQYFTMSMDFEGSINHFLAALSGLGGGYITTGLIKKFQTRK